MRKRGSERPGVCSVTLISCSSTTQAEMWLTVFNHGCPARPPATTPQLTRAGWSSVGQLPGQQRRIGAEVLVSTDVICRGSPLNMLGSIWRGCEVFGSVWDHMAGSPFGQSEKQSQAWAGCGATTLLSIHLSTRPLVASFGL